MQLEFTVVSDIFMTPTAALADIVLPAAWGMEREELGYWPGWYEEIQGVPEAGRAARRSVVRHQMDERTGEEAGFGRAFLARRTRRSTNSSRPAV